MVKVTFKDVAHLAGVSTQTVSRVTNNAGNVTEDTRQRVLAAIEQLGYVPSKSAQLLGRKRSRLIGLITLDLTFFGAAMVAAGVRRAAQDHGYSLALAVTDEVSPNEIKKAVQELRAQQVDAVIINMPIAQSQAIELTRFYNGMPIVFSDTHPAACIVTVMSDHERGARIMVEHLISDNRKYFFCMHGAIDSPAAQLRREGWIKALHSHGMNPVGEAVANWSAHEAYERIQEVLTGNITIDAILCANDQMALGVLKALHDQNIAIPEMIAVTGFDDTPDSAMYLPALTTIQQDFATLGKVIMDSTLQLLGENDQGGVSGELIPQQDISTTVPVGLVVRESSVKTAAV